MPRARVATFLLVMAGMTGCGSDSSTEINPPGNQPLPVNGIGIVLGAQTKGSGAFAPNPLNVSLADGGVVQWFNRDETRSSYGSTGVAHNITADDGSFASGSLAPGGTFQTTFTSAGEYGYHCSIHPPMSGSVTVTP